MEFEETCTPCSGFVDSECFHDTQRSSTLKRAGKATISIAEGRRLHPARHLRSTQKKTARVRIRPPLEENLRAQNFSAQHPTVVDILPTCGEVWANSSIYIELVQRFL